MIFIVGKGCRWHWSTTRGCEALHHADCLILPPSIQNRTKERCFPIDGSDTLNAIPKVVIRRKDFLPKSLKWISLEGRAKVGVGDSHFCRHDKKLWFSLVVAKRVSSSRGSNQTKFMLVIVAAGLHACCLMSVKTSLFSKNYLQFRRIDSNWPCWHFRWKCTSTHVMECGTFQRRRSVPCTRIRTFVSILARTVPHQWPFFLYWIWWR